jgi:hypothetical protein
MRLLSLLLLAPLLALACGKAPAPPQPRDELGGQRPIMPQPGDVTSIRVHGAKEGEAKSKFLPSATLTEPAAIGEVVDWLHTINWQGSPRDTSVMAVTMIGQLEVSMKDKKPGRILITSDGVIVGFYFWSADVEKLRAILERRLSK